MPPKGRSRLNQEVLPDHPPHTTIHILLHRMILDILLKDARLPVMLM